MSAGCAIFIAILQYVQCIYGSCYTRRRGLQIHNVNMTKLTDGTMYEKHLSYAFSKWQHYYYYRLQTDYGTVGHSLKNCKTLTNALIACTTYTDIVYVYLQLNTFDMCVRAGGCVFL